MKKKPAKKSKEVAIPVPYFKECVDVYFTFVERITGFKPAWGAMEGKAMKELIRWLQANKKQEIDPPKLLQMIFDHYDFWDPFHRQQLKINQINSNIINIVHFIKNAKRINDTNNKQGFADRKRELQRRASGLGGEANI